WLATSDAGLCANLYAAREVAARGAAGKKVAIEETTDYPFADTLNLKLSAAAPARLPPFLRIPGWSGVPWLVIHSSRPGAGGVPGTYLVINREWKDGDTVTLRLPTAIKVKTWDKNHSSASVYHGPLAYSLKIGERWVRYGGSDAWPEFEVYPTTPFNYGLV